MLKMLPTSIGLGAALLIVAASTLAQPSLPGDSGNPFATSWTQSCTFLVYQLLHQPELQPVLDARPIPIDVVCPCVRAKIESDPHAAVMLTTDQLKIQESARNPRFKPYFLSTIMSAVMVCAGPELEISARSLLP